MHPPLRHSRQATRGAALVLLLLLVLGAASLAMGLLSRSKQAGQREQVTLQRLATAREALLGYAVQHGRLPRPATSAIDGQETLLPCSDDAACTGFLPWVTLGIERSDGWDHLIRYSVTPELTAVSVSRDVVPDKVILARRFDGNFQYVAGQDVCTAALLCVPAVLWSTGERNFGVSELGIWQAPTDAAPGGADELVNLMASQRFISRVRSDDASVAGGRFDDLVSWLDAGQLLLRMSRANQLH